MPTTNSTSIPKLTDAQAETLERLFSAHWDGDFLPEEAFPARDNADNGARRCLKRLAAQGLLAMVGRQRSDGAIYFAYRLLPIAREAYQRWLDKHEGERPW
jgi:hypothetical protein